MAHFAEIKNNLVVQVIVVDNDDILDEQGNESESVGNQFCTDLLGGIWVQTSYNDSIRYNYAGIGDIYDAARDAFISPQPYPSWVLNEITCQWEAPTPYPETTEGSLVMYTWDEEAIIWTYESVNEEAEEA